MQPEKTDAFTIPNEGAWIPEVRLFIKSFLMDVEASDEDIFDILLAVEEAASNAHRHATPPDRGGSILIRCFYSPAEFAVQVIDDGPGFTYDARSCAKPPPPLSTEGRGLFLMNVLMDRVDVVASDRGAAVTMSRHLSGIDDAPWDTSHDRTYEGQEFWPLQRDGDDLYDSDR
jgi:serine/threonine-protein kinase RsbW